MEFEHTYSSSTQVRSDASATDMSFSPDLNREPTYFVGDLHASIEFREAISALHDVVVSNLKYVAKDRAAYKAWRETQDDLDLAYVATQKDTVRQEIDQLASELNLLRRNRSTRMNGFYRKQQEYFNYLYKRDYQAWYVLDPVITVHPDEVFFECFSQDESSYGRLGVSYEVFKNINEFACGTTNVDYSEALYQEFQKIRSYKTTSFSVDPSGFEVQTQNEETHKEVKIDLPDTWMRGFLQVNSAMSMPATTFDLHPLDVHNICFVLRRNKEKLGPRGMRYILEPNKPVRIVFEPWNLEISCPRSIYTGYEAKEIRVWGRRRMHMLERLIPIAKRFTVHLLGTGLPSFYVADLGHMSFTLGLSGWTKNDWAQAGNFDLMAPRADVDSDTKRKVFEGLKKTWFAPTDQLVTSLGLDRASVLGALSLWSQAGRVMYDLNKGVYRARELTKEPLNMDELRFSNPREAKAHQLVDSNKVTVQSFPPDPQGNLRINGSVRDGEEYHPYVMVDADERVIQARCTCGFYLQNKMLKGPCSHMLAARIKATQQRQG